MELGASLHVNACGFFQIHWRSLGRASRVNRVSISLIESVKPSRKLPETSPDMKPKSLAFWQSASMLAHLPI